MNEVMTMMKKRAKKRRSAHPIWERGYRSWGFWEGNNKLGVVELGEYGDWDGVYRWRAAHRIGESQTLSAAKRMVEEFAQYEKRQLSFGF
jgi:hypothetical protein